MSAADLFEASMLVCFSISWYWSIAKMVQVKVAFGKSAFSVILVMLGYILGLGAKFMIWWESEFLNPIVWLYVLNLFVVGLDLFLVVWFTRRSEAKTPRGDSIEAQQVGQ